MLSPLRGSLTPLGVAWASPVALWWPVPGQTCMAAYQPIGAASLAASYINLAQPGTYDAAPGVAPTLGAGGWVFDGINDYLTTGIVPTATASISVLVTAIGNAGFPIGNTASLTSRLHIYLEPARYIFRASGELITSETVTNGNFCIAGQEAYRNGVSKGTIPTTGDNGNIQLFIGALNYFGNPTYFQNCTIAAVAIYSTTLSAADVAALSARMALL